MKFIYPAFAGIAFVCFALCPVAEAVSPAPDGGYAGDNTAEGTQALQSLTTGVWNSAFGFRSLFKNETGIRNTAVGYQALYNTNGVNASGTGLDNVGVGVNALFGNTTGPGNTAVGSMALQNNTTGDHNTAIGNRSLQFNTIGGHNTALGWLALSKNTGHDGSANCAIGDQALGQNTTGFANTALGSGAGSQLTTGNFNIDIGNPGVAGESETTRIGVQGSQIRAFIAGISGTAVTGTAVVVDGSGQLGVAPSSERFKDEVKAMDTQSEAILGLRPVTFRYKAAIDRNNTPQFGLVAEDVEKVNPDLVVRDQDGKPYTVRYDAVNAMLLNEFLKERRKVEELQSTVAQLTAHLKEQDSKIDKISNERRISGPAAHVVVKR